MTRKKPLNMPNVNEMTERELVILKLKEEKNWSRKEIAELFNLTEERVKQILYVARSKSRR